MAEVNYSALVRELQEEYFEHRITRVEYVARRRSLMDQIDREFNGDHLQHQRAEDAFTHYINHPDSASLTQSVRTIPGGRQRIK